MKRIVEYKLEWPQEYQVKTSATAEFLAVTLNEHGSLIVVFLEDESDKEVKNWSFCILEKDDCCSDDPEFESTMYLDSVVKDGILRHVFLRWE